MSYLLTEENIKHATLSFLKTYYKNNSSRGFGDTVATLNMQTGDGIIADGYLKFSVDADPLDGLSQKEAEQQVLKDQKPIISNDKVFLATFEATSQATAEEIQYTVQRNLLFIDAMAIASIIAATSYGYNYLNDQFTLNELGLFNFFAGFFAVLLVSMLIYMFLFKNLFRYRYIYALEQFKKYHADEQWVAYGEDVFANTNNKYLLELKRQCIRQGFGLITVDKNLQPFLVVTPTRKSKTSLSRKVKNFFEEKTGNNKAFKWLYGIKLPFLKTQVNTSDYNRYAKSYWKQLLVVLAMLFVMGEIYIEELRNPNIEYVDESLYEQEVRNKLKENPSRGLDYVEDAVERENQPTTIENTKKVVPPSYTTPNPSQKLSNNINSSKKDALIISTGLSTHFTYDCSRLAALSGNHFLVQIDLVDNSAEAIQRIRLYGAKGFNTNAVWLGCFNTHDGYAVYLDDIFNNKTEAVNRAETYKNLLSSRNEQGEVLIRMISGK